MDYNKIILSDLKKEGFHILHGIFRISAKLKGIVAVCRQRIVKTIIYLNKNKGKTR